MRVLRIYDSGTGDCLALRDGMKTLFIYDTGQKECTKRFRRDQEEQGFGRALDQALVIEEGPATVVISQPDPAHFGGLQAWAEELLERSQGERGAYRKLAAQEIKEVWCNIPPQDIALARMGGLPVLRTSDDKTPETIVIFDGVPDVLSQHESGLQSVGGIKRDALMPKNSLKMFQERQKTIQELFGGTVERSFTEQLTTEQLWGVFTPGGIVDIHELLTDCFPKQREFVKDVIKGKCVVELPCTPQQAGGGSGKSLDRYELMALHMSLGETCRVWLELLGSESEGAEAETVMTKEFWSGLSIEQSLSEEKMRKLRQLLHPFTWHSGEKKKSRVTIRTTLWPSFVVAQFMEALAGCATPHEAFGLFLARADEAPSLDQDTREKLAILKLIFGVAPLAGIEERMNLYKTLEVLGVNVRGMSVQTHLGPHQPTLPDLAGLDYAFLAPDADMMEQLMSDWYEFEPALKVRHSFEQALVSSLSAPSALSWRPDGDVSNRSSISLWVKDAGPNSTVVLTGDTAHSQVINGLCDEIAANGRPEQERHYYQIPDHGSIQATNPDHGGDVPPRDVLCPEGRMARAFSVGGVEEPVTGQELAGPNDKVLAFHAPGARTVNAVRGILSGKGKGHYDIRLQ